MSSYGTRFTNLDCGKYSLVVIHVQLQMGAALTLNHNCDGSLIIIIIIIIRG